MAARLAILAAVLAVGAGCSGAGSNKAGGSEHAAPEPVVLTLFTGDSSSAAPEFAAAVERLSRGSMRVEISVGRVAQVDYERFTVEDVRVGKAQLGLVGARIWDTMGATSLRALVAPFLVDSFALERRVLESPLAARMLEGLDRAGVVGVAVLPGRLRRPLGLSRRLLGPGDYAGATIGIRPGGVARATFQALGATAKGYVIGRLSRLDGAELDTTTIASNGYDVGARGLTANVVLWPNPQTIVANREAFERLTPAQQEILRRAGRETVVPELARIEREQDDALSGICARHPAFLVDASAADLEALRGRVRRVYGELERGPVTRELIAKIEKLRNAPADVLRCRYGAGQTAATTRLEGLWRVTTSRADLLRAGAGPSEADRQRGQATLDLEHGHWLGRELRPGFVWQGPYTVDGDVLRLTTAACRPVNVCVRGAFDEFTWSVYRDTLSLAHVFRAPFYYGLIAKPLTRVR